jgi:glycine cleavage system aminomethyltransferase T
MVTSIKNNSSVKEFLTKIFPESKFEQDLAQVYTDIGEEYHALRFGVTLRDTSRNILLKMFGKEVLNFLNRISTGLPNKLQKHSLLSTLFLNTKGGIIDRPMILNLDNLVLIRGSQDDKNKLLRWIERYVASEDIILENATNKYFQFEIIGPQSKSFLSYLFGELIEQLKQGDIKSVFDENRTFFIANISEKNICKYLIFGNIDYSLPILRTFIKNQDLFDFSVVGNEAYEKLRIELGIPHFPNELNDYFNPFEVGLGSEIAEGKDFYIGSDVIKQVGNAANNQKKMIGIAIKNDNSVNVSREIVDKNGVIVGNITSITKSERLNKTIGLGFLNKNILGNGSELSVLKGTQKLKICTQNLPFLK